jgi:hypothetical protein
MEINNYLTELECLSNKELLQEIGPRNIIKNTKSRFITYKKGVYTFKSNSGDLLADIKELSKEYPNEVFIARTWSSLDYYYLLRTIRYKAGNAKVTQEEPVYESSSSHIKKIMGAETFKRLEKIAMLHLREYEALLSTSTLYKEIEQEITDEIDTYITITVEYENFKIAATRISPIRIRVEGFVKELKTPSWRSI